jgi:hypothetical protein
VVYGPGEYGILFRVTEPGWDAIGQRVLRPQRPDFRQALAIALGISEHEARRATAGELDTLLAARHRRIWTVAGAERDAELARETMWVADRRARAATSVTDAWKRLAPASWLGDDRRWFVGDKVPTSTKIDGPALHVAWTAWVLRQTPSNVEQVIGLCSDVKGVAAAEDLAREAARRLFPWTGCEPPRVVWFVEAETRPFDYRGAHPFRARFDEGLGVSEKRLGAGEMVAAARNPPRDAWLFRWAFLAKRDLVRANAWAEAPDAGDGGANPFAPVMDIWRLGYALLAIVDDAIVLAAAVPQVDDLLKVARPLGQ